MVSRGKSSVPMYCVAIANANANITTVLTELPLPVCCPGEGRQLSEKEIPACRAAAAEQETLGKLAKAGMSPLFLTFPPFLGSSV